MELFTCPYSNGPCLAAGPANGVKQQSQKPAPIGPDREVPKLNSPNSCGRYQPTRKGNRENEVTVACGHGQSPGVKGPAPPCER